MVGILATAEIDVHGSAARVWSALVDPNEVEQYMFGTRVETDWSVGSPIVWRGEYEGSRYEDKGTVLEYDEPRRLSFTHFSPLSGQDDAPENYHTLVYSLAHNGSKTRVELSQDNNGSEEEAQQSRRNWQQMLEGLRRHVEAD